MHLWIAVACFHLSYYFNICFCLSWSTGCNHNCRSLNQHELQCFGDFQPQCLFRFLFKYKLLKSRGHKQQEWINKIILFVPSWPHCQAEFKCIEMTWNSRSINSELFNNPLSPSGDQQLISPYNFTAWFHIQVRRIKKIITEDEMSWFLGEISPLVA